MSFPAPGDAIRMGIFGKKECSTDEQCAERLGFEEVASLNQVHGSVTHIVRRPVHGTIEGDGMLTDVPGLALSVRWADCQAFAISAPEKKIVGVLHVGWRGMAAQAITAFSETLEEHFSVKPEDTWIFATPSLCLRCAEFTDPKRELPQHLHPFIHGKNVDLQAAADAEFSALGIPLDHRERHPACTKCGEGFWSWRRDKSPKARNYLVVGLDTRLNGSMVQWNHASPLRTHHTGQRSPRRLRGPSPGNSGESISGG